MATTNFLNDMNPRQSGIHRILDHLLWNRVPLFLQQPFQFRKIRNKTILTQTLL